MTEITKDFTVATIIELHEGIVASLKRSVEDAIQIGELLEAKKAELKHGKFLPWIERELPFKERVAQKYMAIYRWRDKTARCADLKDAYGIAQIEDQKAQEVKRRENTEKIDQFKQTGEKPEGWDRSTQYQMDREEAREEFEAAKAEVDAEKERKPKPDPIENELGDLISEVNRILAQHKQHESLRLDNPLENASQEEVFEYLVDYIYRFDGVSRQLEATHNLIKKLRMIASDLQRESTK